MTFKIGTISTLVALASSISGAQMTTPGSDIANSMTVFRNFEQLGRAEKASLLRQTAVLHLEVREGQNKGDIMLSRTQDISNLDHGIVYEMIPSNIEMGDRHLISRMSWAWNAELGRFNQCRTDKIFCDTLTISEKNYIVQPIGQEQLDGVNAIHFTLKPRKQYEGMVEGDIWINPQTSHVVREKGTAVALNKLVRNNSYDRTYTELNGEVIPVRQIYHVSAFMVGTFDAVYDYSDVKNMRGTTAAPILAEEPAPTVATAPNSTDGRVSGATATSALAAPAAAVIPSPLTPHSFGSRLRAIFSHLK